ncbi:hypothetical protein AJR30_018640, partial [Shigella flexneri]
MLSGQIFCIPLNNLVGDKINYDEITKITARDWRQYRAPGWQITHQKRYCQTLRVMTPT